MATAVPARAPEPAAIEHDSRLSLVLLLALPVIAFEQFLHTSPAAQSRSPGYDLMYWLSDALLALPLAAVAVWAGGRIADRLGFESSTWSVFARAGLIALAFGVCLIPGWFLHDTLDSLAGTAATGSGPAGHSGHSHGGGSDEVHWASDTVFRALVLVPLAAAALWGGERIRLRLTRGWGRTASLLARAGVIGALLAAAVVSAWFLEIGADAADSGPVTYTDAVGSAHFASVRPHAHPGFAHVYMGPILVSASSTDGSPAADLAHALRDGLAGQAVGLPVLFVVLLWRTGRPPSDRGRVAQKAKEKTQ